MNASIKEFLKYLNAILPEGFDLDSGDSLTVSTMRLVSQADELISAESNKNTEYSRKDLSQTHSFSGESEPLEELPSQPFPRQIPEEDEGEGPCGQKHPRNDEIFCYRSAEFL